jgi:hypothetical protein
VKRVLAVAVLLVLVPTAVAASMRTVTAPAPVRDLELDGARIVYATGRSEHDCNRVYVWNLATRGVTKLGRRTHCEQTSTGNEIAAVSIAGTRVLWVHYAGGNIRDWSLWTATPTRPTPRRLRLVSREADAPAPIVIGQGDSSRLGDLLPYAVDRTVVALRADGSRRFAWTAPARVVALSALDGELAVATLDARVTILDASGRVLRTELYEAELEDVRLTGSGVLVHRGNRLELRDGSGTRNWRIPPRSRLEDVNGERALYHYVGEIRSLRFTPYVDRPVTYAALARLDGSRLVTASGRSVRAGEFR